MAVERPGDEVRETYNTVARSYADQIPGLSAETDADIALIDSFATRISASGGGTVLDAGAGPGRVTHYLSELGLDISGVDLSPGMVEVARATYPGLRFAVGTHQRLDVADASLAGLIAWYSIIHTALDGLPAVFAEFARALRPGGFLLLGFHAGSEVVHVTQSYGHEVMIDLNLFSADAISQLLAEAGFTEITPIVRAPEGRERRPQAFVSAQRSRP
jgi:SAM-dependent methyltransferase